LIHSKRKAAECSAHETANKGEDIYNTFKSYASKISMRLHRLSATTTDRALLMMSGIDGLIALCKNDESFPNFMSYHYIIHQEALCIKILPFGYVIDVITTIINSTCAATLQRSCTVLKPDRGVQRFSEVQK
jgi:hypothetical protein